MLLTDHERAFLAVFIREATTDPFKGPATTELHRRDIYYNDLPHLLAAYYREVPPVGDTSVHENNSLSSSPWPDRESALRRDDEVKIELEKTPKYTMYHAITGIELTPFCKKRTLAKLF